MKNKTEKDKSKKMQQLMQPLLLVVFFFFFHRHHLPLVTHLLFSYCLSLFLESDLSCLILFLVLSYLYLSFLSLPSSHSSPNLAGEQD